MSYEVSAAEVAEDYRRALEDLNTNLRYEISNLTLIARENTEHAQVISDVLQSHIMRAAPHKKLPALYVLDSIVKNVGTPYTLFFGAKLYQTFMESYASVDGQVRRKMDEMLKTWKEPVPNSLDKRPVFSPEITRPIETALLKARTSALQAQQERQQQVAAGRGRGITPYRETPTPPGLRTASGQPGGYGAPGMPQINGIRSASAQLPTNQHMPQYQPPPAQTRPISQPPNLGPGPFQPPHQLAYGALPSGSTPGAGISIDSLSNDIQNLIGATKVEFAQNPNDASIQTRLKGLLDLQSILQRQNLPQDQLVLIKNQVAELAVKVRPNSAQTAPAATPVLHHSPPSIAAAVVPPPGPGQQPPVTLDSLLGKGALAALLSRQSATPQVSTPTAPFTSVAIRTPPTQNVELRQPTGASAPPDASALLAGLRQAGLIPAAAAAPTPVGRPPRTLPGLPILPAGPLPPGFPGSLSPMTPAGFHPAQDSADGIELNATSLKLRFRPHLIPSLFDHLGAQCTQCGRRFKNDEEGRKKRMAHMDWHFRVHQRIAEFEKRGQHRSWYVDHLDWLKSREVVDVDHLPATEDASSAQDEQTKKESKLQYIPVPDASSGINSVCPICQEKFENKWLDTAQEWVWLDTVLIGNRAYHRSCHSEATRAREDTPGYSRNTPEPVLGKRKAEDDFKTLRGKPKMDGM